MTQVFKLPDVGEGLTEAEIVSWKVTPGDTVGVNDVIVEIETAKSSVELPCPYAGTVAELLVSEGQTVAVGSSLVRIGVDEAPESSTAEITGREAASDRAGSGEQNAEQTSSDDATGVLVGYGPQASSARRRPRNLGPAEPAGATSTEQESGLGPVRAKPPVRKRAKDLGVDLRQVRPTGTDGTVTRGDVEAAVNQGSDAGARASAAGQSAEVGSGSAQRPRETRVPVRGVRKRTAEAMVASAFTAPHVTEWVTLDVSATVELVERLQAHPDFRDLKVSPLLVTAKACLLAARRTPEVNATWDDATQEIVLRDDVNLGIAVATSRGLVVPNIKRADQLPLSDLCRALGELSHTARAGTTPPEDMQGSTFTITNVGVFGVDAGTPILNPGESAILALGSVTKRPWVVDEEVVPRWVTTLAASFDHRILDGEQASRFLVDVAAIMHDPGATLRYA